jgi:cytoskeletal protein RodZ
MRTRRGPGEIEAARYDGGAMPRASAGVAGRDEQIGQIFRKMRLAMKVSRETVARRLATSPAIVDSFEAGAIAALPHWRETARIINGYCELLRLDPEPILWRVRSQMYALASQPNGPVPAHKPRPHAPAPAAFPEAAPRPSPTARTEPPRKRRRLGPRAMIALAIPVVLVAILVGFAHLAPRPAYRAIMLLPDPLEASLRAGLDYLVLMSAPRRDGLRWIDVDDPRLRKADKLRTSTP